jgi:hypothetical protein
VPDVTVETARFDPPDPLEGSPARLSVAGSVPDPLRGVGSGLFTMQSPAALLGLALGVPKYGYRRRGPDEDQEVDLPAGWVRPEPCCLSHTIEFRGEVTLSLPSGWSVRSAPNPGPIESPWIEARTERADEAGWRVAASFHRGRYARGSFEERLEDLSTWIGWFRQPFLIATNEP